MNTLVGYESSDNEGSSSTCPSDVENNAPESKRFKSNKRGEHKNEELPILPNSIISTIEAAPTYTKRFDQKQSKQAKKDEKEKFELPILGYQAKSFKPSPTYLSDFDKPNSENELGSEIQKMYQNWLMPCLFDPTIMLDRFDVRNLVHYQPRKSNNKCSILGTPNSHLDALRFADLDPDESQLFDLDEDEKEEFFEERNTREHNGGGRFGYNYDLPSENIESTVNKPLEAIIQPGQVVIPEDEKQRSIIEKTASYFISNTSKLLEIKIQTKQANNPLFGFLSRDHIYHSYFQQVKTRLRLGICSSYSSDEDESQSKPTSKE